MLTPWDDHFPVFAAETVDSMVAFATALLHTRQGNRLSDGVSTVEELRRLEFEGLSGPVSFSEKRDRKEPKFAIIQGGHTNGTVVEIGSTGVQVGTAAVKFGLLCFPGKKCGSIPSDSYPVPKEKLAGWVLGTISQLGFSFLALQQNIGLALD